MCDAILVVPGGLTLPSLRGRVRRYFDERYGHEHVPVSLLLGTGSGGTSMNDTGMSMSYSSSSRPRQDAMPSWSGYFRESATPPR